MIASLRKSYAQLITSGAQVFLFFVMFKAGTRGAWIVCIPLIAVISVFAWTSARRRRRMITDTPTSRIASAAQGYVELQGKGRPLDGPPLSSHLTGRPCLWYRWHTRERIGKTWVTLDSGESEVPFLLDDGSGRCVIDVEGAEILTRHAESWGYGDHRHTEWRLLTGDTIYALGEFRTLGGVSAELDARQDMNELLSAWKQEQDTLLERFDLDRDGKLDEREWGLARQAARREVSRMHREARDDPGAHTLSRPGHGRHYLLSNIDPNRLARHYLLWSCFHLAVFLTALGAIHWLPPNT